MIGTIARNYVCKFQYMYVLYSEFFVGCKLSLFFVVDSGVMKFPPTRITCTHENYLQYGMCVRIRHNTFYSRY